MDATAKSERIGRNSPCPCESGRKYKKCCLDGDETARRAGNSVANRLKAVDVARKFPRDTGLSPYVVAKIATDPASANGSKELLRMIAKLKADRWTLMKVAAMTTNAIEEQLRSYGVRFTRDGFLAVTHGRSSAWSIADEWLRAGATCRGADEDFLGMAACELWKRILPERPSVEMIDDWMQDGYLLLEDGKPSEACDLWWKVWSALRTHHFSPAMSTMHRADDVFRGSQSIFNWSQDFEMEVRNAALDNAHFNEIGGQFCEEWLAQFVSESQPIPLNFGQCRAELTANSGDEVRALELFDELPTLAPEEPWAYVFAADAHAGVFHRRVLPFAPEKAEPLYRRALSLARNADDRHAIQDRLSDLRARVLGPHD